MLTLEIKNLFFNFFKTHNHIKLKSSKLIPYKDNSLLFTNSGMVPFKNIFLGNEQIKYLQAISCQNCIRVGGKHNDLENVGYTNFHNTFFEMLGNFSFGSYFKQNAIKLAWKFIINELKISKKNLFVTVHYKDKQSYDIWLNEIGIKKNRILKFNQENFWQMSNIGPCGFCTEIYFCKDKNIDVKNISLLNNNCIEIWNLVFIQFEKDISGKLHLLSNTFVDTGMGLERIASIKQNVFCNYEIDIFKPLLSQIKTILNISTLKKEYLRIIADHIKSSAFLISEGLFPNNNGPGYVLRRLIRRSLIYSYKLGMYKPYLYKIIDVLDINIIHGKYLHNLKKHIKKIIFNEEIKFISVLDKGIKLLNKKILNKYNVINGNIIYKLYDTYGLPYDLIKYFLKENDIRVDSNSLIQERKKKSIIKTLVNKKILNINKKNYLSNLYKYKTQIIQICNKKGKKIKVIKENIEGIIILKTTSFVFESCGKISDIGYIYNDIGKFKVYQVKKYKNLYLHLGRLLKGYLLSDNNVNIYIDKVVRDKISINHSAIHLLNETLKRVLNINIVKKGFLINEKKITFDFNYYKKISNEKLFFIEQLINNEIIKQNIIFIKQISRQDKNLVCIGKEGSYSIEVCNGTHIKNTKNIGIFCIVSEKSVSKGIRRIEALTNKKAIHYIFKNNLIVKNISYHFKQNIKNIEKNILNIINKQKIYIDNFKRLKKIKIKQIIKKLLNQMFYLYEYKILIKKIKIEYKKDLFLIINKLVKKLLKKSIIILYFLKNNSIYVFIKITKDCLNIIQSSVILKKILKTNQNIFYNKNNEFSYIKTSIKNISILYTKKIKKNIKNILKK